MRFIELIKLLWKSPVYKIMLPLMAIGFVWSLSYGIINNDYFALFSTFLLAVMFGELMWFTNIIEQMKNPPTDD